MRPGKVDDPNVVDNIHEANEQMEGSMTRGPDGEFSLNAEEPASLTIPPQEE